MAALLAPFIALAAAAAAPAPAELPGVWEGNVGTLPVRACFMRREWGAFGAYYYLSRRRLIALEAVEGRSDTFREGGSAAPNGPLWRIERADAAGLTARWTGGGRTLAVRLNRVARMEGDESPCSNWAFNRPRLEGVRTVSTRMSRDGVAYTRLRLDQGGRFDATFESFALDGADEPVRRINAALGQALTGDPPHWFECIQDSLAQGPFEGSFEETLIPTMITRRWLSVTHHWNGFCGGAHPDASNSYRTFDRRTGQEVDLHDWFTSSAVKRERFEGSEEETKSLQPAFRDFILAGWHPDPADCDEAVRSEAFWTIGLTRDALAFSPDLPHVAQACGEVFRVPFARLGPYLTQEGAENLRALQAEAAPAARTAR